MRHRCRAFLYLFLAAITAGSALAQTTGDLDGTVTDQNGGPLPGASVELRSPNLQGVPNGRDGRRRAGTGSRRSRPVSTR